MEKERYELSGEDRASLGLASVIFMLGLFFGAFIALMVCMPMRVHAEESTSANDYFFEWMRYNANSSNSFQTSRISISSDMRFCLLEVASDTTGAYPLTYYAVVCNDFVNNSDVYWDIEYSRGYKDEALTQLGFDLGSSNAYHGLGISTILAMDSETLANQKHLYVTSIIDTNMPIFTSVDDAVHYIETGYNPTDISTKFTDVYDPSMPVPQLGNLTHAGFTVVDAPEGNYYLQLQIESTVYGLGFESKAMGYQLGRDNDWIYAQQTRNLGSWDVPVSNQLIYNLVEDWDYNNVSFLAEKANDFYTEYPKVHMLPGYDFWKMGQSFLIYDEQMAYAGRSFLYRDDEAECVAALNKSVLPTTKYYVRYVFYDVSESGEYVPRYSQWMSYKIGYDMFKISPVVGDASGNPIDTDPVTGTLDENGDFTGIIGSGLNSDFNINTENPVTMLADLIEWLVLLPELFGDFSLFLQDAFAFIPAYIWRIFGSGIAICVLCVILKYA